MAALILLCTLQGYIANGLTCNVALATRRLRITMQRVRSGMVILWCARRTASARCAASLQPLHSLVLPGCCPSHLVLSIMRT